MEPKDPQPKGEQIVPPEPDNPHRARGIITLGANDPTRLDEPSFKLQASLFHASKKPDFNVDEEFDYASDKQAEGMTLGRGLYTTSSRERAVEYMVHGASDAQDRVFSLIPYQAQMLDLRQVNDPSRNAAIPKEIVVQWVTFARPQIEARLQEWQGDLGKAIPRRALNKLWVRFQHLTERDDVDLREDILGTWDAEAEVATPGSQVADIWDSFCEAQGIDGVIYNEGGEMNFAERPDTTYVFNNLSKVGTHSDWQRRAENTQPANPDKEQLDAVRERLKELSITPEEMLADITAAQPTAEMLTEIPDKQYSLTITLPHGCFVSGRIVYDDAGKTLMYIDMFQVNEELHRNGIGTRLLKSLAAECSDYGVTRLYGHNTSKSGIKTEAKVFGQDNLTFYNYHTAAKLDITLDQILAEPSETGNVDYGVGVDLTKVDTSQWERPMSIEKKNNGTEVTTDEIITLAHQAYDAVAKEKQVDPATVYHSRSCERVSEDLARRLGESGHSAQTVLYNGWDITSHEVVIVDGKTLIDATWQQFLDRPDESAPKVMIVDISGLEAMFEAFKIPEDKRHIWRKLVEKFERKVAMESQHVVAESAEENVDNGKLDYRIITNLYRLKAGLPNIGEYHDLMKQLNLYDKPEDIPADLISKAQELHERCRAVDTSHQREIPELTPTTFKDAFPSSKFLEPSDIDFLAENYPNARYFFYENHVGNWKPVLLTEIDDKKYVVKRVRDDYPEQYEKVAESEPRPSARFRTHSNNTLGFFEFMGADTVDFSDTEQISQVVNLGIESTKRHTTFDPNPGNFIVKDGKVWYVDVGLTYGDLSNEGIGRALLDNIYDTMQNIPYVRPFVDEYRRLVTDIIRLYTTKLPSSLNETQIRELAEYVRTDTIATEIRESGLRHVLNRFDENTQEEVINDIKAGLSKIG